MITDSEYHRLANTVYRDTPKTTAGRAQRAIAIIRRGHCEGRWYDNCFEMGDGNAVFQLVIEEIRKHPEVRQMMVDQGFWGPNWQRELQEPAQASLF